MQQIKFNRLLSGLLSLALLTSLTVPAFAYNSIGSDADDLSIGEDTVQGMATEYHDPISSNVSSAQTDVYVTRSSTFTVLVPKTIILSGADGIGYYVVGAKGDVLPEDAIQIEPDSYELTLYKKDDSSKTVDAVITQDETSVSGAQVEEANGAYATMEGAIRADLKAGSWSAKMQFNIRLIEDGEVVEPSVPENPDLEEYTVTLVGVYVSDRVITAKAGEKIELPVLTATGYTFNGWHDGNQRVSSPFIVTYDATLTATWTPVGGGTTPSTPSTPGTTPTTPSNPSTPGQPAHPHNLSYVSAIAPTYNSEGNIGYWYCADCDKYFSDADGENEISYEDTVIPPMTRP